MKPAIRTLPLKLAESLPIGTRFIILDDEIYWKNVGDGYAKTRDEAYLFHTEEIKSIRNEYPSYVATIEVIEEPLDEVLDLNKEVQEPSEVILTPGKILFESIRANPVVIGGGSFKDKESVMAKMKERLEAWSRHSREYVANGNLPPSRSLGIAVLMLNENIEIISAAEFHQFNVILDAVHGRIFAIYNKSQNEAQKKVTQGVHKTLGYI